MIYPERSRRVWLPGIESQIDNLLELKFHEAAGFTGLEFRHYVPEPQKDGGLIIVSARCLNIAKHCQLLGIRNCLNLDRCEDIIEVPPTFLYWRYDCDEISGRTPVTIAEVLAIIREAREVVEISRFIDAPGSRAEGMIPVFLMNEFGGIELKRYIQIGDAL